MKEIVTFPSGKWTLHGIVHTPRASLGRRLGVVLFNENYNTKFGTHRLYRKLADALSEAGYYVLRYDARATCDSPGQSAPLTFADRVADARAAAAFFSHHYQLDHLVAWGLCMGAAMAVHAASRTQNGDASPLRIDGLVLCNILAHPADASLPEFGYNKVGVGVLAKDLLFDGNFLRRLWYAPRKLEVYRKNLPKLMSSLLRRYRTSDSPLDGLRAEISRVGELLGAYPGPCLLIFSEKDIYRRRFVEEVNPNDRLGLAKKKAPAAWVTVADGDHTFASAQQTAEMIHSTLEWLAGFHCTPLSRSNSSLGEKHGIPAASTAE